jgi:hypothetical protein
VYDNCSYFLQNQSQWPRGLGDNFATDRLLRLWVRISAGAWMFVSCVVCCQVEVSVSNRRLVHRSAAECGAIVCDIETS